MDASSPFRVEREDSIAWLILNRPETRNTMTRTFFLELRERFSELDADPDIRVVVIRAEGPTFCAGLDLAELSVLLASGTVDGRERLRREIEELQESIRSVERCRKPVIAAIHGHCIGGGMDLASACDIRIASEDAVFSIRETRMAIVADLGTLQRLPSIVGEGWCRELALTGRDFTAREALEMGFVTRVCGNRSVLYEEARTLARAVAANSPLAAQGVKEVLLYGRDHGPEAGLKYVAQKNAVLLFSEDLKEAVDAFKSKRPPRFRGR